MNLILLCAILQRWPGLGAFARDAGVSRWKLSRILRGHLQADEAFKAAVASKLGVDPSELFCAEN